MDKAAISVTVSNAEPETQFLAGMPTAPATSIARTEVLAIPRRVPKTLSLKTEGGVPAAISEGAREMVDQLERKFGEAFVHGFLDELEKDAALWPQIKKWLGGAAEVAKPPTVPLQEALGARKASVKTRLEGVKPVVTRNPWPAMKTPAPGDEFLLREPRILRIERARGRTATPAY